MHNNEEDKQADENMGRRETRRKVKLCLGSDSVYNRIREVSARRKDKWLKE